MTKMKAGDEIEVNGKVYVVGLSATKILTDGCACRDCAVGSNVGVCNAICGDNLLCPAPVHMNFKLKGDSDVQDENADDRQVSPTQERQPTDMG